MSGAVSTVDRAYPLHVVGSVLGIRRWFGVEHDESIGISTSIGNSTISAIGL